MPNDRRSSAGESLHAATNRLNDRIRKLKRENPQPFEWYPYDSFGNVPRIERLLGERYGFVLEAARNDGLLDIGCGDGEMAFLFESLGCRVTGIDHRTTNHNGMRGVRTLKRLLGSEVEIVETDLDEKFALPAMPCGLALFLGALYHLKNPYQAMERLASHASFCMFSTRIARCFPDGSPIPPDQPIAYLLGRDELNADASNYWIFSQPGLERLFARTQWEILQSYSVGDTSRSDPASLDRDERYFCLLRSHYGLANVELLDGWHAVEGTGWRWTGRAFSLRASLNSGASPERITMELFLSPELFARLGPVTLSGTVNGNRLRPLFLDGPGEHIFQSRLPSGDGTSLLFTFELDRAIPPQENDPRERGIIVAKVDVK